MPERELDYTPDPCESPLLDPGSDGLVQGSNRTILEQLHAYHEAGHSAARIRRDFALAPDVSNGQIAAAADYGRRLREAGGDYWRAATRGSERRRLFGGIPRLPSKAEWEAQQRGTAAQAQGEEG